MDYFDITFRFNDKDKTLSRFNGLSIETLAEFLKSLHTVTKGISEDGLVLSEIKGNCYAIVCSTPSLTTSEYIQTLHSQIASGSFSGLKAKEKEYSYKILDLLDDNLTLNVYNKDKSFYKTIVKTELPKVFPFFHETDSVSGILTRIGGRNINTKNTIMVSSYPGEIEITNHQDKKLKNYYKSGVLEFYITKKINKNTLKVEKTTLDDFIEVKEFPSFVESVLDIQSKYGEYFAKIDIENE